MSYRIKPPVSIKSFFSYLRRRQSSGSFQGLQVHRDVERYPAQRGRAAGRRAEANPAARDARQEARAARRQAAARLQDLALT